MNRLGLALGSGGARGWCHVGVINALREMDVTPDVVAGCSMGALVGAAWAGERLGALEDWARGLTQTGVLRLVDLRFRNGGLMRGSAVGEMLRALDLPERIEELKHPFIAVATDMVSGREVWIREGSLFDAVRASISIPGIYSPHLVAGKWLLDGGLVNPVPTSACRALGADKTIAVNPNGRNGDLWTPRESALDALSQSWMQRLPEPMRELFHSDGVRGPNYIDVVSTSVDIMTEFVRKTRDATDPPHVSLQADLSHMTVLELYRAAEAIAEGERLVAEQKEAIAAL
ncbi:NTE family protein [Salinihabitans flavidus]|uniref:NTE family protein n=1 Tax=Salinihabitans flavidus TaxID=569882 RepID=A0A1H8QCM3_9RHOB|nr:patatin-like phospholipase family protein [Salinihabitans flavidus]SEO51758.1 NTE family protein [Salinihabitans flavidus]